MEARQEGPLAWAATADIDGEAIGEGEADGEEVSEAVCGQVKVLGANCGIDGEGGYDDRELCGEDVSMLGDGSVGMGNCSYRLGRYHVQTPQLVM